MIDARSHLESYPNLLQHLANHSREAQKQRDVTAATILAQRIFQQQQLPDENNSTTPTIPLPLPTYSLYPTVPYMELPDDNVKRDSLQRFIDATNNASLKKLICITCGGYFFPSLCHPKPIPLSSIPNSHHLIPDTPHISHVYTQHMLLERAGITQSPDGIAQGILCLKCYNALTKNSRPAHAIARGFWVGEVPDCLQVLTLAERILIQLAFPRVYLVKLRPKKRTSTGNPLPIPPSQLHDGLSGSVSSVQMPTTGILQMLEGTLNSKRSLPNPSDVLAHTISIAYLGFGNAPPYYLRGLFNVRRKAVHQALLTLREINPLYRDIAIDEEALNNLPYNGIPDSIIVRDGVTSDMVSLAQSEGVGYTRTDDMLDDIPDIVHVVDASNLTPPVVSLTGRTGRFINISNLIL